MKRSTDRQAEFQKRPAAARYSWVRGLLAAGVFLLSVGLGLPVRQHAPEVGAGSDAASRASPQSGVEHKLAGVRATAKSTALAQRDRDSDKGPGRPVSPETWPSVLSLGQVDREPYGSWRGFEIAPALRLWRAGFARAPPGGSDLTRTAA